MINKSNKWGRGECGAVKKTRTSTDCSTATSTLRVYQFRHNRTIKRSIIHFQKKCNLFLGDQMEMSRICVVIYLYEVLQLSAK